MRETKSKRKATCESWRHGNAVHTERIQRESGNFRWVYVDCPICGGTRGIRLVFNVNGEIIDNAERIKRGLSIADLR